MTEEEWLRQLKPGDPVLVEFTWVWKPNDYVAARVERITPSGIIVLDSGERFSYDGRKRGSSRNYYARTLRKPTPERLDAMERYSILERIGAVRWVKMPLGKLRAVAAALDAESGE